MAKIHDSDGGEVVQQEPDQDDEGQGLPPHDHRDDGKPIVGEEWIGELIFTTWGYGQTNVDAAIITGVSGSGRTVTARMDGLERVGGVKGSDSVRPADEGYGDEFRLRVKEMSGDPWFRGSYPYIDGDEDQGTRLDSFMPWGDRETTHSTPSQYGH